MNFIDALDYYQVVHRFNDESNIWWPESLPYGVSDEKMV